MMIVIKLEIIWYDTKKMKKELFLVGGFSFRFLAIKVYIIYNTKFLKWDSQLLAFSDSLLGHPVAQGNHYFRGMFCGARKL